MDIQKDIVNGNIGIEDLSRVKLYTIKQAAEVMGIAVHAVRKFVRQGKLKHIPCGKTKKLISLRQMEEFIHNELSL